MLIFTDEMSQLYCLWFFIIVNLNICIYISIFNFHIMYILDYYHLSSMLSGICEIVWKFDICRRFMTIFMSFVFLSHWNLSSAHNLLIEFATNLSPFSEISCTSCWLIPDDNQKSSVWDNMWCRTEPEQWYLIHYIHATKLLLSPAI